jgi:hypothetical protein
LFKHSHRVTGMGCIFIYCVLASHHITQSLLSELPSCLNM